MSFLTRTLFIYIYILYMYIYILSHYTIAPSPPTTVPSHLPCYHRTCHCIIPPHLQPYHRTTPSHLTSYHRTFHRTIAPYHRTIAPYQRTSHRTIVPSHRTIAPYHRTVPSHHRTQPSYVPNIHHTSQNAFTPILNFDKLKLMYSQQPDFLPSRTSNAPPPDQHGNPFSKCATSSRCNRATPTSVMTGWAEKPQRLRYRLGKNANIVTPTWGDSSWKN